MLGLCGFSCWVATFVPTYPIALWLIVASWSIVKGFLTAGNVIEKGIKVGIDGQQTGNVGLHVLEWFDGVQWIFVATFYRVSEALGLTAIAPIGE
jgi:hypothetical protein